VLVETSPYLSVVATARNDDHGGRLLHRLQLFVDGLAAQCDRHRLEAELVLVEWNPPADKPRLAEALCWPESERCTFRIVEVPQEVHATLEYGDRLPLFQMIAKNVGIRRAHGDWILATNIDVLLSDELMRHLALRNLDPRSIYRVDRHDVADVFTVGDPIDAQLAASATNVIRICSRNQTRDLRTGELHRIYRREMTMLRTFAPTVVLPIVFAFRAMLRALSFGARWTVAWFVGRRRRAQIVQWTKRSARQSARHAWFWSRWTLAWVVGDTRRSQVVRFARHPRGAMPSRTPRVRPEKVTAAAQVSKPRRAEGPSFREQAQQRLAWERALVRLHTNACGDFTLLSRDAWERLRGYPELAMFSMHIDSLLLYQAHWAGYRERVLHGPLFHIEHSSGFTPESWRDLEARVNAAAIPQITYEKFRDWTVEMRRKQGPLDFNEPDWGFAGMELPEIRPAAARAER